MPQSFFLVAVLVGSVSQLWPQRAEADGPITTGLVQQLLVDAVPLPPKSPTELRANGGFSPIPVLSVPKSVIFRPNLTYARYPKTAVKLDLFLPKDSGKELRPGLILIHGGAWRAGSKADYRYYGGQFAERGYVTVSINYRLVPEHPFPACLQDCKTAVRWMKAQAKDFRIDPEKIAVFGGSAGGHLALMVGYTDTPEFEGTGGHPEQNSRVAAVVDLYGPTDMTVPEIQRFDFVAEMFNQFLGATIAERPELYRLASPITHVSDQCPPTLVIHGTADSMVPITQSDALVEKLKDQGIPYVYDRIPDWPHAMDFTQPINDRVLWMMERFLANALKTSEIARQ
ncbi:MAG: alpha/beta hydrolase [Planctomycetaceae bacterium]|nr:alpha/beta hydrolase [Planctomycetaceae bacterium]